VALDQHQHAKAEAWLNQHLKGKHCPVCGRSAWHLHNAVNALLDVTGGALPVKGHVTMYPVVIYRCGECSYLVTVAANTIGIEVGHPSESPPA
jgi:hypothetical protein